MALCTESQKVTPEEYDNLKDTFAEVIYKDSVHKFERKFYDLRDLPVESDSSGHLYFIGYEHKCPKCGIGTLLNNTIHKISFLDEKMTVMPSLVCPHKCGWHVWIKDGVATDC